MIKNKIVGIFLLGLMSLSVYAQNINFLVPDGLPAMSIANMISDIKNIGEDTITYKVERASDALVVDMLKREGDIGIVPSNFSAQLYNKNLNYKILGTVGWGSFYVISRDNISSINDLKGKKVYTFGKGLTPDIIFQSILEAKGLDKDDLEINYLANGNELAMLFVSKKIDTAVIPEPMLSKILTKSITTNVVANLNDEWKNIIKSDLGYPQATLVVKEELYRSNPKLVDKLVKKIRESSVLLYKDKERTIKNIKENNITVDTSNLDEILKRANIYYTPIFDCQEEYNKYFKNLNGVNSKVIGGKVPDEEIFAK